MILFDNVAKVMGIFEKLIARLEKIKEAKDKEASKHLTKIEKLEAKVSECTAEMNRADKAIKKLKEFTE